ncbi:hypothetical protein BA177_09970 [Woeseia oceani]|uniref:Uncharacterized protein n=2 Tax=Woeseia oceani TaxID=1548547 RepID=A0A193LG20_9GAMM|nr:hypothetical protein BA177_09970 [Woeseia oceani]
MGPDITSPPFLGTARATTFLVAFLGAVLAGDFFVTAGDAAFFLLTFVAPLVLANFFLLAFFTAFAFFLLVFFAGAFLAAGRFLVAGFFLAAFLAAFFATFFEAFFATFFLLEAGFFFADFFAAVFFLVTFAFLPAGFLRATAFFEAAFFRDVPAFLRVLLAVFFAGIFCSCWFKKNAELYIAYGNMEALNAVISRLSTVALQVRAYIVRKRPYSPLPGAFRCGCHRLQFACGALSVVGRRQSFYLTNSITLAGFDGLIGVISANAIKQD